VISLIILMNKEVRTADKNPDFLLIIIAVLLPFIAVGLRRGIGKDLLINILLCIIGYVPGIIHALWIILK